MQLTPKPVTAVWYATADNRSVLRILDYTGDVKPIADGRHRWIVYVNRADASLRELDWGITESGIEVAHELVENVIRDHYEG
jgi:hypothetical protein